MQGAGPAQRVPALSKRSAGTSTRGRGTTSSAAQIVAKRYREGQSKLPDSDDEVAAILVRPAAQAETRLELPAWPSAFVRDTAGSPQPGSELPTMYVTSVALELPSELPPHDAMQRPPGSLDTYKTYPAERARAVTLPREYLGIATPPSTGHLLLSSEFGRNFTSPLPPTSQFPPVIPAVSQALALCDNSPYQSPPLSSASLNVPPYYPLPSAAFDPTRVQLTHTPDHRFNYQPPTTPFVNASHSAPVNWFDAPGTALRRTYTLFSTKEYALLTEPVYADPLVVEYTGAFQGRHEASTRGLEGSVDVQSSSMRYRNLGAAVGLGYEFELDGWARGSRTLKRAESLEEEQAFFSQQAQQRREEPDHPDVQPKPYQPLPHEQMSYSHDSYSDYTSHPPSPYMELPLSPQSQQFSPLPPGSKPLSLYERRQQSYQPSHSA